MVPFSSSLPSLAHARVESDAVTIWMFWLCCKALAWVPACWRESLGKLTVTQCWPTPSRFVAAQGMSLPPFFQSHGHAKCWDRQLCPTERDGLDQCCAPDYCSCELAPSTLGKSFQQSSEDLLAQPFPTAGQFGAPVSQLDLRLTLLTLHQHRPGSLSFFPGCVPQKRTARGMRSPVPGCWMLSSKLVAGSAELRHPGCSRG